MSERKKYRERNTGRERGRERRNEKQQRLCSHGPPMVIDFTVVLAMAAYFLSPLNIVSKVCEKLKLSSV